jgi:hypothetical protein
VKITSGFLLLGIACCGVAAAAVAPAGADPASTASDTAPAPTAFAGPRPHPVLDWGQGDARSYWVPALDVAGFEVLLNRFDHYVEDKATYPAMWDNLHTNLHRAWVVDNDKFATNQFLHPYQGATYQGFARSAGLDFWQSSAYTFGGSLLWEMAGENTAPSVNDLIATGVGGNFLGEPLFRLASLMLQSDPRGEPGLLREIGAAILSPSTAFNRLAYGGRFRGVFPSYNPAVFTRIDVGGILNTHYTTNVNVNADPSAPPVYQPLSRGTASIDFSVAYGLPGKPDYDYARPFDYFNLEVGADTANGLETLFSRGLLKGTDYAIGDNYRGIWGLYGLYDYSAPNVFRVSNTAGALGTTGQLWLSHKVALQGTALGGVGYAGGGIIRGAGLTAPSPNGEGQRNYHYGVAPEGLVALRLIMGDRAALDATARGYYISRVGASESTGSETLDRIDVALTVRVYSLHGLTLRFSRSQRDGRYTNEPDSHQSVRSLVLSYTLLGHDYFGAVDWRKAD